MSQSPAPYYTRGPYTANQIREGDPYELSNGYKVECLPGGPVHAGHNLQGGAFLDSDPDVEWAGVDAGFSPEPGTLRAPDVAVAPKPGNRSGWIEGVPPLAVEYTDSGQNEPQLQRKIQELLAAGTQYVWVVRLRGPRRVEVHTPNAKIRVVTPGDTLEAPGVLRNPIPVQAFFDRTEAQRVTFRNLLQREGYESLEAVRSEGREAGREEGREAGRKEGFLAGEVQGKSQGSLAESRAMLLGLLRKRFGDLPEDAVARIHNAPLSHTQTWILNILDATSLEDVFREIPPSSP